MGKHLVSFLRSRAIGNSQWPFKPGLSARDLTTAVMLKWILAICKGFKIGAYLGDISGAFDRVFKDYIMAKLQAAGVGTIFLNFLDSYLSPRIGQVAVEGELSDDLQIANSVFQGTFLGPDLWNLFFEDVSQPAAATGGEDSKFADDLNVFKQFDSLTPADEVKDKMEICRANVHKWGRTNRVTFDADKEHVKILHPRFAEGDPFKLLGCMIDCKLTMDQAIDRTLAQIRPKITAFFFLSIWPWRASFDAGSRKPLNTKTTADKIRYEYM